uniref:Uncharacterized sensor-like histidine kinase ycf26 n=1 Tax=Helminthocladia australis TaxID=260093 RepID=A0A1G4NTB4_9FLOR|nr:Drug sensory protein A [Helminthocladia australis]SCW21898.1 Drug sensory protein A [Helminthocladia australis]
MFKSLSKWFNGCDLYKRFLACITIFFSITYLFLYSVHKYVALDYVSFMKNTSLMLRYYVESSIDDVSFGHFLDTLEQIYLTHSDVCYLLLLQQSGEIISSIPDVNILLNVDHNLIINRSISMMPSNSYGTELALSYISKAFNNCNVLDLLLPLHITFNGALLYIDIGFCSPKITFLMFILRYLYCISFIIVPLISLTFISIVTFDLCIIPYFTMRLRAGISQISSSNFFDSLYLHNIRNVFSTVTNINDTLSRLQICDQKNVDQLILEKSKLETLVSVISDGVILLDKTLKIVFINPAASKNFKFLKSCIVGHHICDYLPSHINHQLMPIIYQMMDPHYLLNRCNHTKYLKLHLLNDTSKTFQLIMRVVLDKDKCTVFGIGIIIQDITNQIGLNEAKTQFISNVSHELRTPLFNIRSFLETLSEYRDSLTEKQQKEFLDIANQETQRLTYLVNDVLDLSRLESDFLDLLESVEFYEIVPPIIQTSQLRAISKKIKLSFQICPHVSSINGYPNLMTQVLSNLIGNSLKFTGVDGRILLKVYVIQSSPSQENLNFSKVRVEIIDEGTGIDELDQSRIFDRFVRLENNVHTLEGTGLGLSIVKNIVEKHGSNVNIHSELSVGSSFWFDLSILEKKS